MYTSHAATNMISFFLVQYTLHTRRETEDWVNKSQTSSVFLKKEMEGKSDESLPKLQLEQKRASEQEQGRERTKRDRDFLPLRLSGFFYFSWKHILPLSFSFKPNRVARMRGNLSCSILQFASLLSLFCQFVQGMTNGRHRECRLPPHSPSSLLHKRIEEGGSGTIQSFQINSTL